MATLYADGVRAVTGLHQRGNTKYVTPRLGLIDLVYTMLGTEAAADVIRWALLPAGSIILTHLSGVTSDGISTTCTLNVGDTGTLTPAGATLQAASANRYAAALDVAAAGFDGFTPLVARFELGGDSWLTSTFATLTVPVAGKKLRMLALFTGA